MGLASPCPRAVLLSRSACWSVLLAVAAVLAAIVGIPGAAFAEIDSGETGYFTTAATYRSKATRSRAHRSRATRRSAARAAVASEWDDDEDRPRRRATRRSRSGRTAIRSRDRGRHIRGTRQRDASRNSRRSRVAARSSASRDDRIAAALSMNRKSSKQPVRVAALGPVRAPAASDAVQSGTSLTGGGIAWRASAACLASNLRSIVGSLVSFGSVTVTSTCRSVSRNRRVGGARRSWHLTGNAVDVRVRGNVRGALGFLRGHGGGFKHYGGGLFHIDNGPHRRF